MTSNTTLFFLRSSELYILKKLLPLSINPKQDIEFFGFTSKDLGLYTLVNSSIASAVWLRSKETNSNPELNFAIKKEYKNQDILNKMFTQLFLEASNVFSYIEVKNYKDNEIFFKNLGFIVENEVMIKKLEKVKPKNKYDDYSSCKWMEP
jgi:hypothetical protein